MTKEEYNKKLELGKVIIEYALSIDENASEEDALRLCEEAIELVITKSEVCESLDRLVEQGIVKEVE